MDNNETPINIFLDFSKAFDTIDHNILLDKLQYYGLDDTALKLFRSYLTNRYQYVQIENAKSQLLEINTGVPQGSILGPLLFIIYINDISQYIDKFDFLAYADDTTLSTTLNKFSTSDDMNISEDILRMRRVIHNNSTCVCLRIPVAAITQNRKNASVDLWPA